MKGHNLLTECRALITGAGSGIGRAIAHALAREGARLAVTDLDDRRARSVAAEIGSDTPAHRLDVTSAEETEQVFGEVEKALGPLDLVVANAGVSTMRRVVDLAGKTGAPLLAHYAASKFAVVGFTQSLAKEVAANGIRVNAVCPGFVRTSMQEREIAWEAELRGMTPAAVREEYVALTPLGRMEEPEDVADAVVFLASELSRFITGESINVTGGVLTD